jgi:hypothetical protein
MNFPRNASEPERQKFKFYAQKSRTLVKYPQKQMVRAKNISSFLIGKALVACQPQNDT